MRLKRHLRGAWNDWRKRGARAELARPPVVESGCANSEGQEIPLVRWKGGALLYGRWPDTFERELWVRWRDYIPQAVTEDAFRVAIDVVLRYRYPHAMPHLTMPYSRKARECFHVQYRETIDDLPEG